MKIKIMSRSEIEELTAEALQGAVAVISIVDCRDSFPTLKFAPAYVHGVSFDDVDNDVVVDELGGNGTPEEIRRIERKYHMFSIEQADTLASFYASVEDSVDCLICQCEHGQSRSAAVAAAIMEYRTGNGIDIFADDRYYPNKVVFRRVLEALRRHI